MQLSVKEQLVTAVYKYFDAVQLLNMQFVGPVDAGVSAFDVTVENEWAIDVLSQLVHTPINNDTPLEEIDKYIQQLGDLSVVDHYDVDENIAVANFEDDTKLLIQEN